MRIISNEYIQSSLAAESADCGLYNVRDTIAEADCLKTGVSDAPQRERKIHDQCIERAQRPTTT